MKRWITLALGALLLLTGCGAGRQAAPGNVPDSFRQISQDEAKEMMRRDDGHVVVDVRRQDEYDAGHIPGAILIPNESIGSERPALLPDLDQIILIYCRSGNRSKQAAKKLFEMGYTNLYEFGGINTWTGEIVTDAPAAPEIWPAAAMPVSLRYERRWVYSGDAEITEADTIREIVAAVRALQILGTTNAATDDQTDILTFTFADGAVTRLEFEGQAWVTEDGGRFGVEGLSRLRALLDEVLTGQAAEAMQPRPTLVIDSGGSTFYAAFADCAAAEELAAKLSEAPAELLLRDYGGFEKVGDLPWPLTRSDASITTAPGDVILYQGRQISVYYDENTWSLTRLARIEGVSKETLLEAFGDGDVTVTLRVEWSE